MRAKPHFSQDFIYQWLRWHQPRWAAFAQRSTFESITTQDIKALPIMAPDKSTQTRIAAVLFNADQEIVLYKAKLGHLKAEKKALMHQLLRGQKESM
ncbi:MAG: restriction endonuclease subunit S [Limnobacter sp.]|nr:restriction endonuclease subunit S [Limnobacter sp.]